MPRPRLAAHTTCGRYVHATLLIEHAFSTLCHTRSGCCSSACFMTPATKSLLWPLPYGMLAHGPATLSLALSHMSPTAPGSLAMRGSYSPRICMYIHSCTPAPPGICVPGTLACPTDGGAGTAAIGATVPQRTARTCLTGLALLSCSVCKTSTMGWTVCYVCVCSGTLFAASWCSWRGPGGYVLVVTACQWPCPAHRSTHHAQANPLLPGHHHTT
jgi:hypothetical protein